MSRIGVASALPWGLAGVALLVVVAVLAVRDRESGSAKSRPPAAATDQSDAGRVVAPNSVNPSAAGRPPDLATMTPSERANRLYVRVMEYAEAGKADSVARFAPMVLAAHQMLERPSADERYHYGRVAEVVGTNEIARAQSDTILKDNPSSLLGLLLAARAARSEKNETAAKAFDQRLLAALTRERAIPNPDYDNHRAEIDQAVAEARRPN